MALPGPFRHNPLKRRKGASSSIDSMIPTADSPSPGAKPNLPNPGRFGAPSRQREYDPIVSAYQEMETAYETHLSSFESSVVPSQPKMQSERQFTGEPIEFSAHDHSDGLMTPEYMDQLFAELPSFGDDVGELLAADVWSPSRIMAEDAPIPSMDLDYQNTPDENPEPDPEMMESELAFQAHNEQPMTDEEFSPLELIVMAETPDPPPPQPDYAASLMTPALLEEALPQVNSPTPPQSEDEQARLQSQYEAQLEDLLNPYRAMTSPFGMPGPF